MRVKMPFAKTERFKLTLTPCKFLKKISLTFGCFIILLYIRFIYRQPSVDISCHYLRLEDDLPVLGSKGFSPTERSIFFHETSCRAGLNPRQACAVESAARQHPEWEVHVLFSAPVSRNKLKQGTLAELLTFGNVIFSRLHIIDYAKKTPLEDIVRDGVLNRTRWRIIHTSDVVRYLTLYKWGGVYLDLDTVSARPLDGLAKNWAARESLNNVSAGALSFSRNELGRRVATAAVRDLKYNFRGDMWAHNGPGVIKRVLKTLCSTTDVVAMNAENCQGFEVYGPELFYPVSWQKAEEYFLESGQRYGNPYTYHVWNKFTENMKVYNTSVYATIAEKYCPLVYSTYKDNF